MPLVPPPPPKRNLGVIIAASLAVLLLICGGLGVGGWLLLRGGEAGEGAADPVTAVHSFLDAVYTEQDADAALALICQSARDEARVQAQIDAVKQQVAQYTGPRFDWATPKVDDQNEERALVSAKVTLTTQDDRTAEQDLKFTVIQDSGWWVCEVG